MPLVVLWWVPLRNGYGSRETAGRGGKKSYMADGDRSTYIRIGRWYILGMGSDGGKVNVENGSWGK